MRRNTARTLWLAVLWWSVSLGTVHAAPPAHAPVYLLASGLSDAETIALTTALWQRDPDRLILLESDPATPYLDAFLKEWQPSQIVKVKTLADQLPRLFPKAAKVVVAPLEPRSQLLQAACLAGILQAPLLVSDGKNADALRQQLKTWEPGDIYAIGEAASFWKGLGWRTIRLPDEAAVQFSYLRHALKKGRIEALVVANPSDRGDALVGMSTLAPWITLHKRSLLLLTNSAGDNVQTLAKSVLKLPALKGVDSLILVASPHAIPPEKRVNPLAGKDEFVETEPLTPPGNAPVTFATGRIFHDNPAVVALMLARPALWNVHPEAARRAVVVSNPGGGLPFLETISHATATELSNRGFQVQGIFNRNANRDDLRAALPDQTIFLWEGHHSTLIRDYEVHKWQEPLRPSLVVLQSCLALDAPKALPFLERGAIGVLGSSTRTFSGSGGALSLSYFDALLYEKQSIGESLRHAKNFLLCFALLKEKRLGTKTKYTGANLRTALAFTLWGDPTLHIPLPALPADSLPPVTHHLHGRTLTVTLPEKMHPKVVTAQYQTHVQADARLAGLLTKAEAGQEHPLVPMVFREVHFPKAPADKTPRLHSRLPETSWVFTYDARRGTGYLLIRPRARDIGDIRFTVEWE